MDRFSEVFQIFPHFALKSREREVKSPCFYYVWWALGGQSFHSESHCFKYKHWHQNTVSLKLKYLYSTVVRMALYKLLSPKPPPNNINLWVILWSCLSMNFDLIMISEQKYLFFFFKYFTYFSWHLFPLAQISLLCKFVKKGIFSIVCYAFMTFIINIWHKTGSIYTQGI